VCAFRTRGAQSVHASTGSAFAQLRDGIAQPLPDYLSDSVDVRTTLKAVRDEYCDQLALEDAYAAALEAEEAGEVCRHHRCVILWSERMCGSLQLCKRCMSCYQLVQVE
jgi:hypothetical protein